MRVMVRIRLSVRLVSGYEQVFVAYSLLLSVVIERNLRTHISVLNSFDIL